jgi:uroporphyrinogen III methyltransferase/synthase
MDGDASTFNGLAEEAVACLKADVPFEIVPGVSAISAVPAYAGVPLTDARTRAIHVIHPAQAGVDVSGATDSDVTAVLLGTPEGVLAALNALLDAGRDPQTPVILTEQGTTVEQRTVSAALAGAAKAAKAARLTKPLMAVVGTTAGLREQLSWFETKPLFGWRILVPRTREQAGSMTAKLAEYGAVCSVVPTISVESPRTPQQMERAIKGMVTGRYEWVGFTSVNAVKAVRERFEEFGLDARAFSGLKVAAVGGVTAKALQEWGIQPDLVPSGEQSAHGLLEDWPP